MGQKLHPKFLSTPQYINESTSADGFYLQRGHLRSLALLKAMQTPQSDAVCLTIWVESAPTLHEAILSQFSHLPQAENEQSIDKMQKCIVNCVVYVLYDRLQDYHCMLSAGNQL